LQIYWVKCRVFAGIVEANTALSLFIIFMDEQARSNNPKLLDQLRNALRVNHYWKDVKATMVYTHVMNRAGIHVKSPADRLKK
jgi:hypothetical protein